MHVVQLVQQINARNIIIHDEIHNVCCNVTSMYIEYLAIFGLIRDTEIGMRNVS